MLDATLRSFSSSTRFFHKPVPSATIIAKTMSALPVPNYDAINITRTLKEDGHKLWGFVIYRGTYNDDEKWKIFMDRFHKEVERSMHGEEGQALLEKLEITVLEDPSWEEAPTTTIRAHFLDWCAKNAEREQGVPFPPNQRHWRGWRYNFCVYMDSHALNSFGEGANPKDFVKLILGPWISRKEQPELLVEKRPKPSWWKGAWPPVPPEFDEVEGNTDQDVGWMMVEFVSLVSMYTLLQRWDYWYHEYKRPPIIATAGAPIYP
jgi:hypothetical protein